MNPMDKDHNRNLIFISLAQFGMALSANFIMVLLPFFAFRISPYSSQETLIWVGLIMGAHSFVVMVASNFGVF